MLNIYKNFLISILCCCLSNVYATNSWDKYLSENTLPKIKISKDVSINRNSITSAIPEATQIFSNNLDQVQLQIATENEEDVFIAKSYSDRAFSQWFDNNIRPVYRFRVGLINETSFSSYGATEIVTVDLKSRLFEFVDFLPGVALDAWVFADGMYFMDNPEISALPDALIAAGLDLGIWWRFSNGFSWELRGAPGVYSDITDPVFSCTATLNLHYSFSENISLIAGAIYRPKWDMEFFPNIGFIWQPSDQFRVHAALPESRIDLFPRGIVNLFATFTWDNITYWLDKNDTLSDTVTFDAFRASVGATITLLNDLELTAELGTHLKHELKYEINGEDTIELDEASFIRASIGHRF
ncbi:MAG: hypothetical protein J6V41_05680 [Kiritimatiellae bacterium]|nr:hypothetical protein [Kiritimatiellia bacterium]